MKIKYIDIAAFGRLKNYHLDLSDSLSVIYGENEKGKSTIMAFVRMMFYGNSGKGGGIDKNPRKKYRPWNSELMAGSITFEHSGVTYRLEREFKSSNSSDKISLINLDTNEKQVISGSEEVGAKFFGLTDAAFERSVFITEPRFASKNESADGEINAKLSNIATTSDDDISFEAVYLRIRSAKEALISKSRKIGKLDKAEVELSELEDKIKDAVSTEETVIALKDAAANIENEIKQSSEAASLLFEQLKNSDKIKKKNFLQRYISAEKERAAAKQRLSLKDGGFADKTYISSLKNTVERLDDLEEKAAYNNSSIEDKKKDIAALSTALSTLDASDNSAVLTLEEKREELDRGIDAQRKVNDALQKELLEQQPIRKNNLPLIIIGVVLTLLAVAGFFALTGTLVRPICLGAVLVGIILFVLGFLVKTKVMPDTSEISAKINESSAQLSALLESKEQVLEEISRFNAKNNEREIKAASNAALIKDKEAVLDELIKESESLLAQKVALGEELRLSLGNLKVSANSVEETISVLEDSLSYYEMLSQKITVLADNAACSSLAEAEEKLAVLSKDNSVADLSESEIDSLKERFKAQSDHTSHLRAELAAIKEKIKAVTEANPPVAVLEREKAELCDRIAGYEGFTSTADLALTTLDEAFRDLRKNYSEVLDQRTADIFTKLSTDKYLTVSVSKSMEPAVTTDEAFGTKESEYLSRGAEEQLYLAMRLAIAELITNEGEKLPIFADDPLSQYDDGRVKKAFAFLKDYSRDKQMIMFTCHSFVKNTAEEIGVKILEM